MLLVSYNYVPFSPSLVPSSLTTQLLRFRWVYRNRSFRWFGLRPPRRRSRWHFNCMDSDWYHVNQRHSGRVFFSSFAYLSLNFPPPHLPPSPCSIFPPLSRLSVKCLSFTRSRVVSTLGPSASWIRRLHSPWAGIMFYNGPSHYRSKSRLRVGL